MDRTISPQQIAESISKRKIIKGTPVLSGVSRGTALGSLLFLAYINDMLQCVTTHLRLIADDSLFYRRVRTRNDTKALQINFDKLQEWEKTWLKRFHPDKCEAHIA